MTPTVSPEDVLRRIADLTAQRDFSRSIDFKQNLLDCIALLLVTNGYADEVSVF